MFDKRYGEAENRLKSRQKENYFFMKSKLNFESLKDQMFQTMSRDKMRRVTGGYTIKLTGCVSTTYGTDGSCSDHSYDL